MGGRAGYPVLAVLLGATAQPPCLRRLHRGPTLCALFFGIANKTYLKWEFPQKVASKSGDALKTSFVINFRISS